MRVGFSPEYWDEKKRIIFIPIIFYYYGKQDDHEGDTIRGISAQCYY